MYMLISLLLITFVRPDPCPAGYMCVGANNYPCPAGTYNNIYMGNSGTCRPCPAGYYCPSQMAAIPCPDATPFSAEGAAASTTISGCTSSCTTGTYCYRSMPIPCDLGYIPSTDKQRCRPCRAGYYCPDHINETPCPTGTYSAAGVAYCTPCSSGKYCPSSIIGEITCPSGYYSLGLATSCTICPAGKSCSTTSRSPDLCEEGYYAPKQGMTACLETPAGYYSTDFTTIIACIDGKYSLGHASSCTSCPAGFECKNKAALPTICPAGYYSLGEIMYCIKCPKGSFCANLHIAPVACSGTGKYSIDGSSRCSLCPLGYECSTNEPIPCTSGQYQSSSTYLCANSPAGKMATTSTEDPITCPTGSYSLALWTYCVECPIGTKCQSASVSPVACNAASFEYSSGQETACHTVPNGYRFAGTSVLPIFCPPGYYQTSDKSQCAISPQGSIAPVNNLAPVACTAGQFSAKGNAWCQPCPFGYYCPDGNPANMVHCSIGQYSAASATTSAGCVDCPAGKSCATLNSVDVFDCQKGTYSNTKDGICFLCPAGYKCDATASTSPTACSDGMMATEGWALECAECYYGKRCPFRFQMLVEDCEYGYYSSTLSSSTCSPCPLNKHCESRQGVLNCGASQYSFIGDPVCRDCPGGFSLSAGVPMPCPIGKYSVEGNNACADCPLGSYCPVSSRFPIPCPPGYYADTVGQIVCKHCDPGYYSNYKTTSCMIIPDGNEALYFGYPLVPCRKGYYSKTSPDLGWSCLPCLPGYTCEERGLGDPTATSCPSGFFCNTIEGPTILISGIHACPPGTMPKASATELFHLFGACEDCPAGFYCTGGAATKLACPDGYYCPAKTTYAHEFPCPAGMKHIYAALRSTLANSCQDCGSTFVCYEGTVNPFICPPEYSCSSTRTPILSSLLKCHEGNYNENGCIGGCGQGNFCPYGAYLPTKCFPGTYTDGTTSIRKEDCTLCTAGKACPYFGMKSTDLINCQDGYYCPKGTISPVQNPLPQGIYTSTVGGNLVIDTAGTICPDGKACYEGTGPGNMEDCPLGFFCVGGKLTKTSPGTYINVRGATADGTPCTAGYYCLEGTILPENECFEGFYCSTGTSRFDQYPCPAGTYSNKRGLKAYTECTACEPGYYCPLGSTTHYKCPIGTFNSNTNQSFSGCTQCTPGYQCPTEGMAAPISCGKGYYSVLGAIKCYVCPNGYSCPNVNNNISDVIACPAGKYCSEGVVDAPGCPIGYFCIEGAKVPQPCYPGTYRDIVGAASSSDCTDTPPGQYSHMGKSTPEGLCKAGYYCPVNSFFEMQVPCNGGTFRSVPGAKSQADCENCPAGFYCPRGTSSPIICPQGYYCIAAQSEPALCPKGSYGAKVQLKRIEDCNGCPEARYCSQRGLSSPDGMCDPGFFCPENSTKSTQSVCNAGGYCDAGSVTRQSCPPGRYNPNTGGRDLYACTFCDPGKSCSGTSATAPTGGCDEGFYCPRGSKTPKEEACMPGYICPANSSVALPCDVGYYNPYYQQTKCLKCPPGFYCTIVGNANTFVDCPVGYYCPEFSTAPTPCPIGTYNPNKFMTASTDCLTCPPGYFCSLTGQSAATGKCSAGFWCLSGSTEQSPSSQTSNWGTCDTGYYCPAGSAYQMPCPQGTYQNENGKTDCKDCTLGKYCRSVGLSAVEGSCYGGFVCNLTKSKTPSPYNSYCDAGFYCPVGTTTKISCASGTYQPNTKQAVCLQCPKGYFCYTASSGISTFTICPKGKYCPAGTGTATACASGKYNPNEGADKVEYCLSCDPGKYCSSTGLLQTTGSCTAGYYCIGGSTSPTQNQCAAGYYCPAGSSRPLKCPPGYYCPSTLMYDTDIAGANDPHNYHNFKCTAGYYCIGNTNLATPLNENTQFGNICPAGYYCPTDKIYKVPCPPGTYNTLTGQSLSTACLKCYGGYYCANYATTVRSTLCQAGYDCNPEPAGTIGYITATPNDRICPAGYYCLSGSAKVACPSTSGNYQIQLQQGKSVCQKCPAGFFCTTATSKVLCEPDKEAANYYCPEGQNKIPCPAGYYNVVPGSSSISDCTACPPGSYCPTTPADKDSKILTCGAGFICTGLNIETTNSTTQCPQGFYCPAHSSTGIPCPAGKYCPLGSTPTSISGTNNDCLSGYYCISQAEMNTPNDGLTGSMCPAGYYCPSGTITPIACPIKTYNPYTGKTQLLDCLDCPAISYCNEKGLVTPKTPCPEGYYCPVNTTDRQKLICSPGYKCPAGSESMTKCPYKTFQPNSGQSTCLNCLAGYYCDVEMQITPNLCSEGKYCPENSQSERKCPRGTFSPRKGLTSSTDCEACPPGYYCPDEGMTAPEAKCDAGYYCTKNSRTATPLKDISGDVCPIGYYCPEGSHLPQPCPPGTYGLYNMRIDPSDCTPCTKGYFCPYYGETRKSLQFGTDNFKCAAGFICEEGSRTAYPTDLAVNKGRLCLPGFYCPKGSYEDKECQIGTYNPDAGQSSCTDCPAGFICDSTQMTSVTVKCTVGNYCSAKSIIPTPCPAGTYMPYEGAQSESECIICPPGKYCIGGKSVIDGICQAGFVCPGKATLDSPTVLYKFEDNLPGKCPAGYYCLSDSSAPIPCEPGTYQSATGQVACNACPAGKYCDEYGLSAATKKCAEGYLCVSGAKHPRPIDIATEGGHLCSAGYYCPEGATREIGCPLGTYEPRTGSAACQNCPAGYYCEPPTSLDSFIIVPKICPERSYCPARSTDSSLYCPEGTYGQFTGLESPEQCRYCPPGFYCKDGKIYDKCPAGFYCDYGVSNPRDLNKKCPPGHYCEAGCEYPTACPLGKVRLSSGGEKVEDCTTCPSGYFCLSGIPIPFECPKGYYCEPGADKPVPCPVGTFNSAMLEYESTACVDCDDGYNCYEKGIANQENYTCEAGSYCEGGDKSILCPVNYYNNKQGAKHASDCILCLDGYMCENEGTINPSPCPPGYICIGGAKTPCRGGYYCPVGASVETPCPAAFFCPEMSATYSKCPIGTYCEEKSEIPTPCPSGTIPNGNANNINLIVSCKYCIEGTYSDVDGTVCKGCLAGYVCQEGATKENPTDPVIDKGYICPKGYYCLERTFIETPCPVGTYNPNEGATALSDCILCSQGMFNLLLGQSSCQTCGSTSVTSKNGANCDCIGKNRIYQLTSKKCVCAITYEPTDKSEISDGTSDCQPIVYQRCGQNEIRDTDGGCTLLKNCSIECNGGNGTRSASLGICICDQIDTVNDICDETCRSAKPSVTFSNGVIKLVTSDGTTTLQANSLGSKMLGDLSCSKPSGSKCTLISLKLSSNNEFGADYSPTNLIEGNALRRRLDDTKLLKNPIVCIYKGDAVAFTVNKDHYPKYCRESLINSITGFDESPFNELETKLIAGEDIQNFIYTFSLDGIAVLQDSLNFSKQTIIAVMGENKKCPDDNALIQPISYDNLLKIGALQKDDIIVSPDWGLIFGILLMLVLGVPAIVFLIRWFLSKKWYSTQPKKKPYQVENLKVHFEPLLENANKLLENQTQPFNEFLISKNDKRITFDLRDDERNLKDIRKAEAKRLQHEVDPKVFMQIYDELKEYAKKTQDELIKQIGEDRDKLRTANEILDDIRKRLESKLKIIAKKFTPYANLEFNHEEENERVEIINEAQKEENEDQPLIKEKPKGEFIDQIDLQMEAQARDDESLVHNAIEEAMQSIKQPAQVDTNAEIKKKIEGDLKNTDDQLKEEMFKELEAQNIKNREIMLREKQALEANLVQRLNDRNAQRQKIKEKQMQMEHEKKQRSKLIDMKMSEMNKENKEIAEVEKEAEEDTNKILADQKAKHDQEWDAIITNYQSKVANEKDSTKIGKYLDKYVTDYEEIRKHMEEEWKNQDDELVIAIQKKKQDRLDMIEKKRKLKENEIIQSFNPYASHLPQDMFASKQVGLIKPELANETEIKIEMLAEEKEKINEEINQQLRDKLAEIEDQYIDQEKSDIPNDIIVARSNIKAQKEEYTNKYQQLLKKANEASMDDKDRLMDEAREMEKKLNSFKESEAQRADEMVKDRREERRKKRMLRQEEAKVIATKDQEERLQIIKANEKELIEGLLEARINAALQNMPVDKIESLIGPTLDRIIEEKHIEEYSALLCQQLKEKAEAQDRETTNLIREKGMELAVARKMYKGKPARLKEAEEQIELDNIGKLYTMEIGMLERYGTKHTTEQILLKEKHIKERDKLFRQYVNDPAILELLMAGQESLASELENFKTKAAILNNDKKKEIEAKKFKLELENRKTEQTIRKLEVQEERLKERIDKQEKRTEEMQKKEMEKKLREQEIELQKRGISEEEKKKLMNSLILQMEAQAKAQEDERIRQQQLLAQKLEDKKKEKEKYRQEREEQIKKIKDEESLQKKPKIQPVAAEKEVDITENMFAFTKAKYEPEKEFFEKVKPILGLKAIRQVKGAEDTKEEGMADFYKVTNLGGDISRKDTFDFEKLIERLKRIEATMGNIANTQFVQLMEGFKVIFEKMSILNDFKEQEQVKL